MKFRITDEFSGEVWEFEFEHKRTPRSLNDYLRRFYRIHTNIYTCPPLLPPQEIAIGGVLHFLPVVLKFSPLIVMPKGGKSENSFIFFLEKREIKIFSLPDSVFVEAEQFDMEIPCEVFSANASHGGFIEKATDIFNKMRPKWDGKLRFAYTNRNTIREGFMSNETLRATDEEMNTEAAIRLRFLGFDYEEFLNHLEISISEQECMNIRYDAGHSTGDAVFLKEQSYYYGLGVKKGWEVAHDDKKTPPNCPSDLKETSIIKYKEDKLWALHNPYEVDYIIRRQIKNAEHKYDLRVYHVNIVRSENDIVLSMLYVGRNIDEWEQTRKQVLEHNPKAVITAIKPGEPNNNFVFENINIKIIQGNYFSRGGLFRLL